MPSNSLPPNSLPPASTDRPQANGPSAEAAIDHGTSPTSLATFVGVLLLALLSINGGVLAAAWQDHSWGALVLGLLIGPAANGVVLLLALLSTLWLNMLTQQRRHFLLAIWLLPSLSAVIVAGLVLAWDLNDH